MASACLQLFTHPPSEEHLGNYEPSCCKHLGAGSVVVSHLKVICKVISLNSWEELSWGRGVYMSTQSVHTGRGQSQCLGYSPDYFLNQSLSLVWLDW